MLVLSNLIHWFPSYTWKSIWAVKGLLLTGLRWRVGNGRNISIEEDVWVPNGEDLLCRGCSKNYADPTGFFLSWRLFQLGGEALGEYTVRSGYKFLLQRHENYRHNEINRCYKKLWRSDLPSKINIIAWRATLNYLPTLINLRAKRLINEASCQRCKQGLKTREHVFRDWTLVNSTTEASRTFICVLWAIWSARNKWMCEGHRRSWVLNLRYGGLRKRVFTK